MKNNTKKMKVLVFGAGVLGSLYAARLKDDGQDVTVVARGKRYRDILEHGIVLEEFLTREQKVTSVRVVDQMPADEFFDVCLVLVQKTQLTNALPVLATNPLIPTFVFMVNTAEGPTEMIDVLGRDRVVLGFSNAGGERDGHVVRLMEAKGKAITLGELNGVKTERLDRLSNAFRSAGFPVETSRNMDAWLRYHVAMIAPWANGFYMAGGCNYRMARNREAVKKALLAMREGVAVVRAHGFPYEPRVIRWFLALPDFVLVRLMQKVLASPIMDIGGKRHAMAARDEMTELNEELLELAERAGMETPMMRELHRYSDPAVAPAYT